MSFLANVLANQRGLDDVGAVREMQVVRFGCAEWKNRDFESMFFRVAVVGFEQIPVARHGRRRG